MLGQKGAQKPNDQAKVFMNLRVEKLEFLSK